jgi:hypothetical protein
VWVLGHDVRIWSPSLVNVVALFYKDKARFARALEKKEFFSGFYEFPTERSTQIRDS